MQNAGRSQRLAGLSVAGLSLLMTRCEIKDDRSIENDRLLNTDRQFAAKSIEQGSAEAFRIYLTPNALSLSAGQHPLEGRENIYQTMKLGQENITLSWEPQRAMVASSGDMGWTWGKYTISYLDQEQIEQRSHGKYLNIWERQEDGQWRVAVDMGNSSPAPEA